MRGLPLEHRIEFRVGVHLGDMIEEADGDLSSNGVNIAARLECIAELTIALTLLAMEADHGLVARGYRRPA